MIKKEILKKLIEQAEVNCSGEKIEYTINDIKKLSEDGAYLVFASSEFCKTSFVFWASGNAYFIKDWQGDYPRTEEDIANFDWVDINWNESVIIFGGLPRTLIN